LNIFNHPRFRAGWILIALATLCSFGVTLMRWAYENSLTVAQLTVDYDDTRTMADAFQVPHGKLLERLKKVGVSSVAIYQLSVNNLRDNGRVVVLTREEAEVQYPDVEWNRYVPAYRFLITASAENSALLQQILENLQEQAQPSLLPKTVLLRASRPGERVGSKPVAAPQFGIFVPASRQLLNDARVGFDPAHIAAVQGAGLRVTARLNNSLNLNLDRLRHRLDQAQATGARVVIFSEDEVLGYNTMIPVVSRELKQRKLLFGAIEFSKQRGLDDIMKRSDGMMVRVHSVSGDEAAKAKRDVLVERYVRAIKERNIRVAYIRLFPQLKGDYELPVAGEAAETLSLKQNAMEQNIDLIAQIARELKHPPVPFAEFLRPGVRLSDAQGFRDYPVAWLSENRLSSQEAKLFMTITRFLAGLGGVGAAWLLLNLFVDVPRRHVFSLLFGGVLACGVLSLSAGAGAKLLALGVGCLITPVAVLWGGLPQAWDAWRSRRNNAKSPAEFSGFATIGAAFWEGAQVLLRTSLITFCGGLMTVALLNKWTYMSKADEFLGEKATQLFPLIVVGVAIASKIFPHRVLAEGAQEARLKARRSVETLLDNPFTVRYLVTGLFILIAGYIWIARTGNDSGMDISPLELKMRSFLENVLITRPRTKEVFIGFPATVLAIFLAWKRRWPLFLGAALAATIGQADLYNTMCHIHTPLFYSILRSIHALWLGLIFGALFLWAFVLVDRRWRLGTPSYNGSARSTRADSTETKAIAATREE
jgi:hypothetical protein